MYHGGNNPHSLLHASDRDAPNTTLQESSFQPAGAANPMYVGWGVHVHADVRAVVPWWYHSNVVVVYV